MNSNKRNILAGAVVAGLVAFGGSAFTAASTIDDEDINVGSVSQSVSGANFTEVTHTYDSDTDTTSAISAKAAELLSTDDGVVTISTNGGAPQACTVTWTDVNSDGLDSGAQDFSSVACDITPLFELTSLQFTVNG